MSDGVFSIWISPGRASSADIAELLVALSELNRAHGGPPLTYRTTGAVANGAFEIAVAPHHGPIPHREPIWRRLLRRVRR